MTSTTSIPTTSAARPQPDVLGAFHTLGIGVGVATADAGAGVGVAAGETLSVTVAALPAGAQAWAPSIKVPGLRRFFLLAQTKQPGAKNARQEAENMTLP